MTAVFADTFFWIDLADLTDSAHRRALDIAIKRENSAIVTADEVLVEYLTYFATAHEWLRRKAVTHVQRILEDPGIRVVPQSRESFLSMHGPRRAAAKYSATSVPAAWRGQVVRCFWRCTALYGARPDKGYSLTDCISMHTMRREGLTEVLTNDRHFEQEGFRALFRED